MVVNDGMGETDGGVTGVRVGPSGCLVFVFILSLLYLLFIDRGITRFQSHISVEL